MWYLLLYCTAVSSLITAICLVIGLYKAYKEQQKEIAQYKETIKELTKKIETSNLRIQTLLWERSVKNKQQN